MDSLQNLKVMVVSDVPKICHLTAKFIGHLDRVIVVGTATSIKEALACITQLEPHAVVLDMNMTRFGLIQNGIDVLRWIKHHFPATNVIMLINHDANGDRKLCQELGAYAVLDKWDGSEILATTVNQLVKARTKMVPADPRP